MQNLQIMGFSPNDSIEYSPSALIIDSVRIKKALDRDMRLRASYSRQLYVLFASFKPDDISLLHIQ